MRPLQTSKIHSKTEHKKWDVFDKLIERRWGTSISPPKQPKDTEAITIENYEDDDEPQ